MIRLAGLLRNLFRRMRGIVGMGLTWSVVWGFVGAIVGVALYYYLLGRMSHDPQLFYVIRGMAFIFAVCGFACGGLFACVLAIAERRRTLEQLATLRTAVWGAIAGALLPVGAGLAVNDFYDVTFMPDAATFMLVFTFVNLSLGAASAAGSLKLARAGQR